MFVCPDVLTDENYCVVNTCYVSWCVCVCVYKESDTVVPLSCFAVPEVAVQHTATTAHTTGYTITLYNTTLVPGDIPRYCPRTGKLLSFALMR